MPSASTPTCSIRSSSGTAHWAEAHRGRRADAHRRRKAEAHRRRRKGPRIRIRGPFLRRVPADRKASSLGDDGDRTLGAGRGCLACGVLVGRVVAPGQDVRVAVLLAQREDLGGGHEAQPVALAVVLVDNNLHRSLLPSSGYRGCQLVEHLI
ncbi:hypothetical protein RHRU231_360083 [Rhodococcus ruber]|uniref:Uncharacterized protein n=1 Tax=Rhodococcus ruber TaxID=1830 RepID=A0A098BGU7_9NOCA|nr:hypothetical protein RHRU231_360083 [Rhodococcus ruber]